MRRPGQEFEDVKSALAHIGQKFTLPAGRFVEEGALLRSVLQQKQTRLADFSGKDRLIMAVPDAGLSA
jgi:hypothetical protein